MESFRDREVECSASDHQGSNFESCVWRAVSSHHPLEVLLVQFSSNVHIGGLKPTSFIHSLPLPLAAGGSMAISLWFCSPVSLSAREIPLFLPYEWQLYCVEIRSHENSYFNYIIMLVLTWLKGFSHRFHLNQTLVY